MLNANTYVTEEEGIGGTGGRQGRQDLPQHQLQRIEGPVPQHDQSGEVVVPPGHAVVN